MRLPGLMRGRSAGLRMRLTLSYVAFFAVFVLVLGLLFRQTLDSILHENAAAIVEGDWSTAKGFLRFEGEKPYWVFDRDDPDEAFIVQRLRRVYLLTKVDGRVLEVSESYRDLGIESPEEIQRINQLPRPTWRVRKDRQGEPYLLRSGLYHDGPKEFHLSLGRSLADNQRILNKFTWNYLSVTPLLVLATALLGWLMAGRALHPLNDVAKAAQSVSGSNLSLRLPVRGAGDELDRFIESFNSMVDRLENSFNEIRRFNIDVSHELRTPLTAIRGQLEVALMSARTVEDYREAVLSAMMDVERLSKIVRAMLQLYQVESGQVVLRPEHLDLAALVDGLLNQFEIAVEEKRLRLVRELWTPARVKADRVQMERMVTNLMSNAVKCTPDGGTIRVSAGESDEQVTLTFADTGSGIPKEHLPHIFERFYQVRDPAPEEERGLGLGLSFVAWIVKIHRGVIHVESEPGKGAVFTVVLPRSAAAPPGRMAEALDSGKRIE